MHGYRTRQRNRRLDSLVAQSGASHKALAHRVNELSEAFGCLTAYTHTSVANWICGMVPRWPTPRLLAQALSERLGRPVSLAEIGMANAEPADARVGLDYARDLQSAIRHATAFWSTVDRREFISGVSGSAFAAAAYATPVRRWLVSGIDPAGTHRGYVRVGRVDIDELRGAADQARHWDSRYGGGSWHSSSLARVLQQRAVPLLNGTYTEAVGRELFSVIAQLARLAGWTSFDTGNHDLAQRHYIQALRFAQAAGDLPLGGYVLACMALQASLRNWHDDAIDMAQGAYERTKHLAAPRVLAFFRLIESRAHARAGNVRDAGLALCASERFLERADATDGEEPEWIDFFTHSRLAADATEIHRDVQMPAAAFRWNDQAGPLTDAFTRSYGLRQVVLAGIHLQDHSDLEQALQAGHHAVDALSHVSSARAADYVQDFLHRLTPWRRERAVQEFTRWIRSEVVVAG